MVLRDSKDPLNTSRGIMGPLEHSAGVQNNRGRLKQRFDLIRKLGQGTYGKVQLGIDKETGQEVAIKTIKKSKIETEADLIRIRREIQIMSSVRHPNIIHIYEVFENREKMVLVMEYAAGGELYDYLNERKVLQEDEARRIFRQIASAVYYCHKNKICHRDLKLENILLDEKANAKIADFGLSNVFDDVNMLKTFCGSPLYASPEIVRGTPYPGPEVDCWSLGVLLYTLVYGAMPFDGSNFKRLVKQISAGDYYEPKKPAEASPLIRRMLTVDQKKRAKVEDICSHPWINQGFDKDCLSSAEELAQQTPVRIDVLLTLAPNNLTAAAPKEEGPSHSKKAQNESDSMLNEPPKKPKLQDGGAPKEGVPAPPKPKRKTQSKTKSKTTPLMLDLIQDVVEEEAEDVEMLSEQQKEVVKVVPEKPAEKEEKAPIPLNKKGDVEADTLSEISEIQTMAEEPGAKEVPKKERVKSVKVTKKEKVPEEKVEVKKPEIKPAEPPKPEPEPPKAPSPKPKEVSKEPEKEPEKEVSKPAEKTVVKKKVVKPKPTQEPASEPIKKAPEPPTKEPEPQPAPVPEEKKPEPEKPEEPTPPVEKDKPGRKTSRARSDSLNSSDASPTRVERRSSKVISQKTAELIQNLETKVSSGSSSGEEGKSSKPQIVPKKLVIPNFASKISDAKNKFETKPPRPITSSVMSASKAAFEAKEKEAQQQKEKEKSLEKVQKPAPEKVAEKPQPEKVASKATIQVPATPKGKSKSPSPTPKKELEANDSKASKSATKPITPEPPSISEATVITEAPKKEAEKPLSPTPPDHRKEQAAKKISSVINKIAKTSSSSGDEAARAPVQNHKTEVTFPVAAAGTGTGRSESNKELVIPIKFEPGPESAPVGKPTGFGFRRFDSGSSVSAYSRQNSTSDTESVSLAPPKPEPIRKSPREFLIPIKLEASGETVTPSQTEENLQGSEDDFRADSRLRSGRFGGKYKRYSSLLSDSSLDDQEGSVSGSASKVSVSHGRSRSQGDEPTETPAATFKRFKVKRPDLDRSDSFSSAEEDEEDFFEVFTADSLFSNLLDRVRNLTKRINREGSVGPGHNWPNENFGLWNPSGSLRDLMMRAPSETRSFSSNPGGMTITTHRSFSRDPSWRRSLSRDVSGDSDLSSASGLARSYASKPVASDLFETTSVRSLPISLSNRRSPSYLSQRSEPFGAPSYFDREDSVTPTPGTGNFIRSTRAPSYNRTISNAEYSSTPVSRTLPFRRSLKTFDRSPDLHGMDMDSMIGTVRAMGQSLIDSPATFDPDSYLRQMRMDRAKSVGREIPVPVREGSVARMTPINDALVNKEKEQPPRGSSYLQPGPMNGSGTIAKRLQNFQREASVEPECRPKSPTPQLLNNTNAIGLARLRPNSMFEREPVPEKEVTVAKFEAEVKPVGVGLSALQGQAQHQGPRLNQSGNASFSGNGNSQNQIPPAGSKWNINVQQYRPLSISSFPSENLNQRAVSVPRVLSPPPTAPENDNNKLPRFVGNPSGQVPNPSSNPNSSNPSPVNVSVNITVPTPKKRETTRATSVERITRFLERKSVPKELPPEGTQGQNASPPINGTPKSKPKFLQSLEKKWEKLTGPSKTESSEQIQTQASVVATNHDSNNIDKDLPVHPPDPDTNNEISPDDNKISESVLLRRALSPEKKVKKFGSGTVNSLLGKFNKKPDDLPSPQGQSGPKFGSKLGAAGRVYAGARSDSVLTLNQNQSAPQTVNAPSPSPTPITQTVQTPSLTPMKTPVPIEPSVIRSAEVVQEKRNVSSANPKPLEETIKPRPNGLLTLRCKSPDMIPSKPPISPPMSPPKPDMTTNQVISPPNINITIPHESSPNPSLMSPCMLSPVSVSASEDLDHDHDHDSGSNPSNSDSRNPSEVRSPSILDEEESVSDRILRKSFYSRFNSLDRNKRSSSLSAAGAARRGISPGNMNMTGLGLNGVKVKGDATSGLRQKSPGKSKQVSNSGSRLAVPSGTENGGSSSVGNDANHEDRDRAPSPHSLVINKYNPNPLFKELITEDFKSDIEKKTEYSRKVTSKLSKLLKEIETDLHTCQLGKSDDEGENETEEELGLRANGESVNNVNGHGHSHENQHQQTSNKPPPFGVGLKAIKPNQKKYGGSKTAGLAGAIGAANAVNAPGVPNNVLSKRSLFNRESSLQPEPKVPGRNVRATSVSRLKGADPEGGADR